jgi:hypothetical protein
MAMASSIRSLSRPYMLAIVTGMLVFVRVALQARLPVVGKCGWLEVPGTGRRGRRSVGD